MKRSEVIDSIKKHYKCYTSGCSSDEEAQEHAENLLSKLETFGMLPPSTQNLDKYSNYNIHCGKDPLSYCIWEKE